MAIVFISHSDRLAANALEDVLRASFPGVLEVFNTSRSASGLAAGDNIDQGILRHIAEAAVVIWLASPSSVRQSFWMAWELGAASALGSSLIPARCLGLTPDRLPLLQGGRSAPDLGTREGMQHLLETLRRQLTPGADHIAETLRETFDLGDHPMRLWGTEEPGTVEVRLLGERLLFENQSSAELRLERVALRNSAGERLQRDFFPLDFSGLDADERRIIELGPLGTSEEPRSVDLRWSVPDGGRHWAVIPVRVE